MEVKSGGKELGRLLIEVKEVRDINVPEKLEKGVGPVMKIAIGSNSYEALPKDTLVVGSAATVTYNWKSRLMIGSDYKVTLTWVEALNPTKVIAKTTLKFKKLFRGETQSEWRSLDPIGRAMIELTALTFGKIDKPTSSHDSSFGFMNRFTQALPFVKKKEDVSRSSEHLKEYQPKQINRQLPHLASGASGVVYKGHVSGIEQIVAVKDMPVTSLQIFSEWKNEFTSSISEYVHPYIVRVYGFCATTEALTIIMEYCPNGTLYQQIHEPKGVELGLIHRVKIARQCCLAVGFLHSHNVMHRDIKSLNFLMTEKNVCKLADFGTAKAATAQFHTERKGTPLWMAPEVRSSKAYDVLADVFSVGVVLYELFALTLPDYDDKTEEDIFLPHTYLGGPIVESMVNHIPAKRPPLLTVASALEHILVFILYGDINESLMPKEMSSLDNVQGPSDAVARQRFAEVFHRFSHSITNQGNLASSTDSNSSSSTSSLSSSDQNFYPPTSNSGRPKSQVIRAKQPASPNPFLPASPSTPSTAPSPSSIKSSPIGQDFIAKVPQSGSSSDINRSSTPVSDTLLENHDIQINLIRSSSESTPTANRPQPVLSESDGKINPRSLSRQSSSTDVSVLDTSNAQFRRSGVLSQESSHRIAGQRDAVIEDSPVPSLPVTTDAPSDKVIKRASAGSNPNFQALAAEAITKGLHLNHPENVPLPALASVSKTPEAPIVEGGSVLPPDHLLQRQNTERKLSVDSALSASSNSGSSPTRSSPSHSPRPHFSPAATPAATPVQPAAPSIPRQTNRMSNPAVLTEAQLHPMQLQQQTLLSPQPVLIRSLSNGEQPQQPLPVLGSVPQQPALLQQRVHTASDPATPQRQMVYYNTNPPPSPQQNVMQPQMQAQFQQQQQPQVQGFMQQVPYQQQHQPQYPQQAHQQPLQRTAFVPMTGQQQMMMPPQQTGQAPMMTNQQQHPQPMITNQQQQQQPMMNNQQQPMMMMSPQQQQPNQLQPQHQHPMMVAQLQPGQQGPVILRAGSVQQNRPAAYPVNNNLMYSPNTPAMIPPQGNFVQQPMQHQGMYGHTVSAPSLFSSPSNPYLQHSNSMNSYAPQQQQQHPQLVHTNSQPIQHSPPLTGRVRMKFDFVAENPGELQITAGEVLHIMKVDGVWLQGRTDSNRTGWVPLNFTEPC